jgi:hypothetical protein
MSELLRARRFPVRWRLAISSKQAEREYGHTINVSPSGLLFASARRFKVGDTLLLDIDIPDLMIIHVTLRIVREAPAPAEMCAYGGRYIAITDAHRRLLGDALLNARREQLAEKSGRTGPLS